MKFRLRAFGLHLCASITALTLILGSFYFGWYRWPGWYLSDVTEVLLVIVGVDLVVGPLLTLVVANAGKSRRELTRDVAMIAVVQLIALAYGTQSLWSGRPLYYAFSVNVLQQVQAYDINKKAIDIAKAAHAPIIPHWYDLPQWIWAPLPEDPDERQRIVTGAITGDDDVISMPRYYQAWDHGLPALRTQLKKVSDVGYFSAGEKKTLTARMQAAGYLVDQQNAIPLTGRGPPLLAVLDPTSLKVLGILKAK